MKSSYVNHSKFIAYFALVWSSCCALFLTVTGADVLFLAGLYASNALIATILLLTEWAERS